MFVAMLLGCKGPEVEDTGEGDVAPTSQVVPIFEYSAHLSSAFCFTLNGRPECWYEDEGGDQLLFGDYRAERVKHLSVVEIHSEDNLEWSGVSGGGELISSDLGEGLDIDFFYPDAGDPSTDVEFANMLGLAMCVLTAGGSVECPEYSWKEGWASASFPAVRDLRAGTYREPCAIDAQDQIVCASHQDSTWTYNSPWAPAAGIKQVVTAGEGSCALSYDGEFYCWPLYGDWQLMEAPVVNPDYKRLLWSLNQDYACVQLVDGSLECFDAEEGGNEPAWVSSQPFPLLTDGVSSVHPKFWGDWVICGVEEASGLPQCWDQDLNERFDW
ncbi:MAG: hypothetical protein VX899_12365 [Myxococcota bacterium]|nr:hypothetical protein [Myxococcota bacterium]